MLDLAVQRTLTLVTLKKMLIKTIWSPFLFLWDSLKEKSTACKILITQKTSFDEEVIRGNEYVDDMLKDIVETYGHEYDPYIIEDSAIGFHKNVLFVNVSGEAKLHSGYILGLKTLHRSGDCKLVNEGDKLKVTADLGAGVLELHYSGTVKFMNMGPTITVVATIAYLELTMKFIVDADTGKNGHLDEFYIEEMKGMTVSITGLGPLNWAMNPLISGVTKLFKGYIRNMVENQLENHITDRIKEYQFPIRGGKETTATVDEAHQLIQEMK